MKIKAIGGCCKKSMKNYQNALEAAKICGIDDVEHVQDVEEITNLGIIATPALMIDNNIVSMGRLLKTKEIVELIKKYQNKN